LDRTHSSSKDVSDDTLQTFISQLAEHTKLCWKLIEWKVAYYKPEYVHSSRRKDVEVPDDIYDEAEQRYLTLCRELHKPNTIVHKGHPGFEDVPGDGMMEVDLARPSVQLVLHKLASKKPTRKRRT
jgi:hypothetical protein